MCYLFTSWFDFVVPLNLNIVPNLVQDENASISSVLRFRKALKFIQKTYLLSYVFGPADTRENCIESAQNVYNRLLLRTPGKQVLEFETLALVALLDDDTVDQHKAKGKSQAS